MTAGLILVGVLIAIVAIAIAVNWARGVRAHYLDAWAPEPGERRLLEDPAADFYVVPRLAQAKVMSFARRGRTHAVLTDSRIVIATKPLLSTRRMITHMVYLGHGDGPPEVDRLSGGLFTTGYIVMSAHPSEMTVEDDGGKAYLKILPSATGGGAMVGHCRLYSRDAGGFRDAATSG